MNERLILHSINTDLLSTVRGNVRELWATMSSVILCLGGVLSASFHCSNKQRVEFNQLWDLARQPLGRESRDQG